MTTAEARARIDSYRREVCEHTDAICALLQAELVAAHGKADDPAAKSPDTEDLIALHALIGGVQAVAALVLVWTEPPPRIAGSP